ncbi:MAG: hypothetical protein L0Y44_14700 [Phycisphaerales bacterium]|nr:hypothetical protein [Phycisphaerales bacterium]
MDNVEFAAMMMTIAFCVLRTFALPVSASCCYSITAKEIRSVVDRVRLVAAPEVWS